MGFTCLRGNFDIDITATHTSISIRICKQTWRPPPKFDSTWWKGKISTILLPPQTVPILKAIKFGVDVFVHIVERLASILTNYPNYPIKIWTMFWLDSNFYACRCWKQTRGGFLGKNNVIDQIWTASSLYFNQGCWRSENWWVCSFKSRFQSKNS